MTRRERVPAALPSPLHHLPPTPENLTEIRQRACGLRESTDYAIMVGFGGNLMEWGQFLRRMDQFFIDLAASPGTDRDARPGGGGFVFTPVHNILPHVPPENISAMVKAVWKFR